MKPRFWSDGSAAKPIPNQIIERRRGKIVMTGLLLAVWSLGRATLFGVVGQATGTQIAPQGKPMPPTNAFPLLPASPIPPEMQAQRLEAENAVRRINQARLTKLQLRQILLTYPDPLIRAKAQQAAQVASGTPYAVTLSTEQRSSNSPEAGLGAQGAQLFSTIGSIRLDGNASLPSAGFAVARPFVTVFVNLPSDGWYLIDFYGWGQAAATLRQHVCCGPVPALQSWAMIPGLNDRHFVTAEHLARGGHSFYFSVDQGFLYFSEASVQSY